VAVVCFRKEVPRQAKTMQKFDGKKKKYSIFQVYAGKNIDYFKNSCIFAT
jgi:hypothetical protein